jgi:hypothetical protein
VTWVRYDDQAAIHRKVAPLDDATYRLWREAIEWCARNTTDGRIAADELSSVSTRASKRRAEILVRKELWHEADAPRCPGPKCPEPGPDGWVIHDYHDYQPTKVAVKAELAAKAERTRKWREAKAGRNKPRDGDGDASPDGHGDDTGHARISSPPRPAPKEAGSGTPQRSPAAKRGGRLADDRSSRSSVTVRAHLPDCPKPNSNPATCSTCRGVALEAEGA